MPTEIASCTRLSAFSRYERPCMGGIWALRSARYEDTARIDWVRGMCVTDIAQMSLHTDGKSSVKGSSEGNSRKKNPTNMDSSSVKVVIVGVVIVGETFIGEGSMTSIIAKA